MAFSIARGPHHDVGTIRGYRWTPEGYALQDVTGNEHREYFLFARELLPPIPGEFWMLTWGQAHTFNGQKVRMRIYAFDGETFKTMWTPSEVFNADDPEIRGPVIAIRHIPRDGNDYVRDEYLLTPEGAVKMR